MPWHEIPLRRGIKPAFTSGVTAAIRRSKTKAGDSLYLNIASAIAGPLGLVKGTYCIVDRDDVASPTALRIRLSKAKSRAVSVRNGCAVVGFALDWPVAGTYPATRIEHEIAGDALILTLPNWARPTHGSPSEEAASAATSAEPPGGQVETAPRGQSAAPQAVEARRSEPAAPAEKLTADRETLFRRMWMDPQHAVSAVLQAVNALPGEPYGAGTSMYSLAKRLGLPTARPAWNAEPAAAVAPAAPAAVPVARPTSPAAATADENEREAEQMVIAGQGARAIAEYFGWPLPDAQGFVTRARDRLAAQRQGRAA